MSIFYSFLPLNISLLLCLYTTTKNNFEKYLTLEPQFQKKKKKCSYQTMRRIQVIMMKWISNFWGQYRESLILYKQMCM